VIQKFGLYPSLMASQGHDAAIRELRRRIKIQISRGSSNGPSAFTLTFDGDNREIVAAVTNELANSFIVRNLSNREQQVQGTTTFISDELDRARQDLQRQEDQLRVFRMGHLGEMPDQANANMQAIGQLQVQLQSLSDKMAQLDEQEAVIETAPDRDPSLRVGNAPGQAAALENELSQERSHLADLKTHVTPEHPDIVAAQAKIRDLESQIAKMPKASSTPNISAGADARLQLIKQERDHLLNQQAAIQVRLDRYQSKVDAVPVRQEQLSSLTRDYDTSRDHYRSLLEKYYSAEMASELEEKQDAERFEVLDPAVAPEHPSAPDRPLLYFASCVAAFLGAFMLAFGLEQLDSTIKSEIDVRKILPAGTEFAGTVSNIARVQRTGNRQIFGEV